ncbi:conserved hypothetical protein [Methylocella silvestris BL2]|uniref:Uncharacterized protein n=1 Tax=Methylocella silvestris (strain DSM 15510 / CIP 108128 / LMG 27833 / NCIMB 13906 / BL2) TaxID=395965 RepID=B8EL11_METSB|nr:hypothetical protein [Methylocella silvestris]ACK49006.1 conserved hypothetical protein [Methylocella silvestris BL2]
MASAQSDAVRLGEEILIGALEPVIAELRLVDVADYVAFIRFEQFANIRDIVESSIELFFKLGALSYAFEAEYELDWETPPVVMLKLEFRHLKFFASFKLFLESRPRVTIEHWGAEESADAAELCARLRTALTDARLPG